MRRASVLMLLALLTLVIASPALANPGGGAGLPWEEPLNKLQESITGPTATALIFIAIAISLAIWAFAESRHLMRAAQAVIALAIIAKLTSFLDILGISAATF